MAEIGRWNSFTFEVSPSAIRGFTGLTIKASCETKDKTKSKQKYVARKNGKPSEVSLTVVLSAALGCDVREEALKLIEYATAGKKDYFYIGEKKLLSCKLMLVDASIKEISIGNGATWIYAQVSLTMKQCGKGSTSSKGKGKKGSNKKSVRSSSKKKGKGKKKKDEVDAITGADPSVSKSKVKAAQNTRKGVSSAVDFIRKNVTSAKKYTLKNKK